MPLRQGDQRSLPWQQQRRMVLNHNWSTPRMSALPHSLQHLLRENNGWRTWRPWRKSQHWRQGNYKLTFCRRHWRPSWTRARAGQVEEASMAHAMQISAEKIQLMTNNTNGISTDITIDTKKLETVRSFKYLGAIVYLGAIESDEGSKPEVLSRIAQTTAAVTKLEVIWNDKNIAMSSNIRLTRSLVMSIFLYACETRTTTADNWKKDTGTGDEMFPQTPRYLVQKSHNQWGSESQNWKRHRASWRPPDFSEKTQTGVLLTRHKITWTG